MTMTKPPSNRQQCAELLEYIESAACQMRQVVKTEAKTLEVDTNTLEDIDLDLSSAISLLKALQESTFRED